VPHSATLAAPVDADLRLTRLMMTSDATWRHYSAGLALQY